MNSTPKTPDSRFRRSIRAIRVLVIALLVLAGGCFWFWNTYLKMPGISATVPETTQTTRDEIFQDEASKSDEKSNLAESLKAHVVKLAETIGERNLRHYDELCEAADYIESELASYGYKPKRQTYLVRELECFNIDAEIKGKTLPDEIVIIGGHYDSVVGTPGANDNGSGTASMLELAKHFKDSKPDRTLRFVAWTNEEPPYFQNRGKMGSWVYAERCRKNGENITAVLSLETMGYFTDEENSQKYPAPLNLMYPSTGNFIGFVSNLESNRLARRVIKTFREHSKVPSEGASLPSATPGVGWSDHWSFWQEGYVGLMVTDTAPFRYPHYHEETDTPDKIDYETLGKVVEGLVKVIEDLTTAEDKE